MGLIVKLHTGFVDRELAEDIYSAEVDIASQEMVGDAKTIEKIFGFKKTPDDYLETFINLKSAGLKYIAPHIAVGLDYGIVKGEIKALKMLEQIEPSTVSIIVFRPTKGTEMETVAPPSCEDLATVIKKAKQIHRRTPVILGMMRPRDNPETDSWMGRRIALEKAAVDAGVDGVERPHPATLGYLFYSGFDVLKLPACGVLPRDYEERIKPVVLHPGEYVAMWE